MSKHPSFLVTLIFASLAACGGEDAAPMLDDAGDAMTDATGTATCPDDCDDGIACTVDACDDTAGRCTHQPGVETCDDIDNDCDGSTDEGLPTSTWWPDRDADLHGDINASPVSRCGTPAGHVRSHDDCDDWDHSVLPGATEVCNGVDDDCDLTVDEDALVLRYLDRDGDGRGAGEPIAVCPFTPQYVQLGDDCDDDNPGVNVGRAEICDAVDNDCDSVVDETGGCSTGACVIALATVCDPDALCDEVQGEARCTCPPGYLDISVGSGTGVTCADIDECRANSDNCNSNAYCTNTRGSFQCTCNGGFEGDGVTCTAI